MVVSNIFDFHPYLGDSYFDEYFSKGLKPPTSSVLGGRSYTWAARAYEDNGISRLKRKRASFYRNCEREHFPLTKYDPVATSHHPYLGVPLENVLTWKCTMGPQNDGF